MGSSWGWRGQTIINGAYQALQVALGSLHAVIAFFKTWGAKGPS